MTLPSFVSLSSPVGPYTAGPTIDVPVVGAVAGDFVVLHVMALNSTETVNESALTVPNGWTAVVNSFTDTTNILVAYVKVMAGSMSSVTVSSSDIVPRRWLCGTYVVRSARAVTTTASDSSFPSAYGTGVAMVTDNQSLVTRLFFGLQRSNEGTFTYTPSTTGWSSSAATQLAQSDVVSERRVSYQPVIDDLSDTFPFTIVSQSHPELTGWFLYTLTFEGAPFVATTPATRRPPRQLSLVCADSYTVWITDASYRRTIDQVQWSSIDYERVLDEISTATVVLPDELGGIRCQSATSGIVPWQYGILIERNDSEVWAGPITSIQRDVNNSTIRVSASDTLARHMLNYAIWANDITYTNVDSGVVFANIINLHARTLADTYLIQAPEFATGKPMSRQFRVRRLERAWTVLQEFLETSIDAYMANGILYCWSPTQGWVYHNGHRTVQLEGPYNAGMDLQYGMFTNEHFVKPPGWTISGMDQANYVSAPTADSGDMGFRTIYTAQSGPSQALVGVLVFMDPNTLHRPDDTAAIDAEQDAAFQLRANTLLALRVNPPAVMSGGTLAPGAPIDFDNLRPGSLWDVDYWDHGYGQLLQTSRLKRIGITVTSRDSGIEENISPTLYPIGYEGG